MFAVPWQRQEIHLTVASFVPKGSSLERAKVVARWLPWHLGGKRSSLDSRRNGVSSNGLYLVAGLAQLVEHLICNQGVTGSNPVAGTTKSKS